MLHTRPRPRPRPAAVAVIGIAATAALLAGCSSSHASTAANDTKAVKNINIVYALDTIDSSQVQAVNAMKACVAKFNASHDGTTVHFTVDNAQESLNTQISQIQTAVSEKANVILVSGVDTQGVLPAVEQAAREGVKVVDMRPATPEPSVYNAVFESYDSAVYAAQTVDWIKAYLAAHPSETLNVGVIYGLATQTPELVRINAIKALAAQMPNRIKIVASAYGNWLTATAQSVTQDWIHAYPNMNYIAAANDIMATGVENALAAANKEGKVLVSGYDMQTANLQELVKGDQSFDVAIPSRNAGEVIDQVAVPLAEGTYHGRTYLVKPLVTVTPANAKQALAEWGNESGNGQC
jgi:ABC-type sugar transport system substrate-binding protein